MAASDGGGTQRWRGITGKLAIAARQKPPSPKIAVRQYGVDRPFLLHRSRSPWLSIIFCHASAALSCTWPTGAAVVRPRTASPCYQHHAGPRPIRRRRRASAVWAAVAALSDSVSLAPSGRTAAIAREPAIRRRALPLEHCFAAVVRCHVAGPRAGNSQRAHVAFVAGSAPAAVPAGEFARAIHELVYAAHRRQRLGRRRAAGGYRPQPRGRIGQRH